MSSLRWLVRQHRRSHSTFTTPCTPLCAPTRAILLAVQSIDMCSGAERLLAQVVQVFGSAPAHHGDLLANACGTGHASLKGPLYTDQAPTAFGVELGVATQQTRLRSAPGEWTH